MGAAGGAAGGVVVDGGEPSYVLGELYILTVCAVKPSVEWESVWFFYSQSCLVLSPNLVSLAVALSRSILQ